MIVTVHAWLHAQTKFGNRTEVEFSLYPFAVPMAGSVIVRPVSFDVIVDDRFDYFAIKKQQEQEEVKKKLQHYSGLIAELESQLPKQAV